MKKLFLSLAFGGLIYTSAFSQIGASTVDVTNAGTDGNPSCCGLFPLSDGFGFDVRHTSRATGLPQANDLSGNYYSLGFGGEVILAFSSAVQNIGGIDIKVYETTSGKVACPGANPERARIWVSQDRCSWVLMGDFCDPGMGAINISLPTYLDWVKFIKIKDITVAPVATPANNSKDGFDLDGVKGLSAPGFMPVTNTGFFGADFYTNFAPGTRKNGSSVNAANLIASRALGDPQNSDAAGAANFVSLGFGGTITLQFSRLIHRSSGNEIQIFETTTGSPTCAAFPEMASVSVSLDGVNWVSLGSVCQNGLVSIPIASSSLYYPTGVSTAGLTIYNTAVRFVKITDVTNVALAVFPGTEDGYDLDGIYGKAACTNPARLGNTDEEQHEEMTTEAADLFNMSVFPNPVSENATIKINSVKSSSLQIDVISITGNYIGKIYQGKPVDGVVSFNWDTSELANGIYFVRMSGTAETETQRIVVQH